MTEHAHPGVVHRHGPHEHRHGALVHDHEGDDHGPHDPGDHDHHPPEGAVARTDVLDADTGTGCGHLGTDDGVARVVIRHRGREWVLCGDCGVAFDWGATDAALDEAEAAVSAPGDGDEA